MNMIGGRPIRVLDLRDTYEIGGPGKTIIETFRALDADRIEMHLGVFAKTNECVDTPFVMAARDCGMPVHVLRGVNPYDPRLITQLIRLIDLHSIDIVHAHEVTSDVITYLASRIHAVPIVTTLHGWIGNGIKQRLLIRLDKLVARKFTRVIAVSKEIEREMLMVGMDSSRITMLHNGIVLERYRGMGRRGVLDKIVGRHVPRPIVASIGRLSREKGHADLLEAVAILKRQGHKLSLVLIGEGFERQTLEAKVHALQLKDIVYFSGYQAQPERFLKDIDLMVLPSHTEGLPNAVLEALLMEVPVLATCVGGTPEVISDGKTGRLVPPHSPDALAAGIIEFLSFRESWNCMARNGRLIVEAQFDFQVRTRRLEALYFELLNLAEVS